jgi:hypothetical protein
MQRRTQGKEQGFCVLLALATLVPIVCIGAPSAVAAPLPKPIAPISADVPISAGGGWVLWSVPVNGRWGLDAYHEGAVGTLRVASRAEPFDVNVGTNIKGKPVATFSRCTRTPKTDNDGSGVPDESTLALSAGAGCRLYALNLGSGRERILPVPHPAHSSDTTPSMWRGEVAFGRMTPTHGDISQVMLWSPRHAHTLRLLDGGEVPSGCAGKIRCNGGLVEGTVQGLDLDADVVTFLWSIKAPGVLGHEGWGVRIDNLAGGQDSLAGSGFLDEACVSGGLELALPEIPIAVGDGVLFSEFRRSACYRHLASFLYSDRAGAARPSSGPLPGSVLGLAKDGKALYALLAAPVPMSESDPGCSSGAPCELERISEPSLAVDRYPCRHRADRGCSGAEARGIPRDTRADTGQIVAALEQKLAAYPGEDDLASVEDWL